jgi:cyclophilin family peptidyl-prolyl cis-trans isomerase
MTPILVGFVFVLAQAAAPPAPSPEPRPKPKGPVVVLDTSLGRIVIGLHQDKAPLTVANFLKYLHAAHYNGTVFHRVIPNFMIQGGGLDADLKERPTRTAIVNEAKNGLRNSRGTVAMARTDDPVSAKSQFFINLKDNHSLDYGIRGAGYAVFGEVLEGMAVVDKIASVPTATQGIYDNVPQTPVVIKTAREVPVPTTTP